MQLPYSVRTLGYQLLGRVPVRVRSGINQGRRWSLATTGRGYGSGSFGADRLEVLAELVRPGECVFDLGAHKGFMSLACARLVGPEGTVVAVEPGRSNLWFLRRHVAWNRAANVRIVPCAVGEEPREVAFGGRGDSLAYQVGEGDDRVELKTLPQIAREQSVPRPTVVKMDIEGQELATLRGAREVLRPDVVLLISVHGRALYDDCAALLTEAGFRLFPSREIQRRLSGEEPEWGGDHDLLAVGADRDVDEERLGRLPLLAGR